jgi:hypothetical protein
MAKLFDVVGYPFNSACYTTWLKRQTWIAELHLQMAIYLHCYSNASPAIPTDRARLVLLDMLLTLHSKSED